MIKRKSFSSALMGCLPRKLRFALDKFDWGPACATSKLILALFFYIAFGAPSHAQNTPWSPQSQVQLQNLAAGGDDFRRPDPNMRSPMEEIHHRLKGFNLSYNSPDLPDACQIFNDLQKQTSDAEQALISALSLRMDRFESTRDGAPRYWGMLEHEPQILTDISYEVGLLSTPRLYLGGFGETICSDLQEPELLLRGIYSGTASGPTLMMFHAKHPNFSMRKISDVFEALDETSIQNQFGGNVRVIEGYSLETFKFGIPKDEIPDQELIGYDSVELPIFRPLSLYSIDLSNVSTIEEHEYGGDFSFGLHEAVDLIKNVRRSRSPSIFITHVVLESPRDPLDMSGTWIDVSIQESTLSLDLSNSKIESLNVHDSAIEMLDVSHSHINDLTVNRVFPGSGWNRISLSDAQVKNVTIEDVDGFASVDNTSDGERETGEYFLSVNLRGAEIENLTVENAVLWRLEAQRAEVHQSARVSKVSFADRISFWESKIDRLIVRDVTDRGDTVSEYEAERERTVYLNHSFINDVDFQNVQAKEVNATGSRFYEIDIYEGSFEKFSMWGSVVEREIHFNQTSVHGFFDLGRVKTDGLRLLGGAYGEIDFWGGNIGTSFVWPQSANTITGWYIKARALVIGDHEEVRNPKIGVVQIRHAQIETQLNINDIQAEVINLTHTNSNALWLSCIFASNRIDAVSISAKDIYIEKINAEYLNFHDAQAGILYWEDQKETLSPQDSDTSDSGCAAGNIAVLDFAGSRFEAVRIAGHISKSLRLSDFRTHSLLFFPGRTSFGPKARFILYSSDIDRLGIPLGLLKNDTESVGMGFGGSKVGRIFLADPNWNGYPDSVTSQASVTIESGDREIDQPAVIPPQSRSKTTVSFGPSEHDYRQFFVNELLPSIWYAVDPETKSSYSASYYNLIRETADSEGFPKLSREISILQNEHFTEGMPWISSKLYRLIGSINQYGYNNARAIVILVSIYCIGFGILVLEYIYDKRRLMKLGRESEIQSFWPRVFVDSLFMSMDRTVPTLSVDEEYSRPVHAGVVENRPVWVIAWLYSQRAMAFIVAAALIGGVFDVFQ